MWKLHKHFVVNKNLPLKLIIDNLISRIMSLHKRLSNHTPETYQNQKPRINKLATPERSPTISKLPIPTPKTPLNPQNTSEKWIDPWINYVSQRNWSKNILAITP